MDKKKNKPNKFSIRKALKENLKDLSDDFLVKKHDNLYDWVMHSFNFMVLPKVLFSKSYKDDFWNLKDNWSYKKIFILLIIILIIVSYKIKYMQIK